MTSKPRVDLTGMQPGDAAVLRRFALIVERHQHHRGVGWVRQALANGFVKGLRQVADRLDAGDVAP